MPRQASSPGRAPRCRDSTVARRPVGSDRMMAVSPAIPSWPWPTCPSIASRAARRSYEGRPRPARTSLGRHQSQLGRPRLGVTWSARRGQPAPPTTASNGRAIPVAGPIFTRENGVGRQPGRQARTPTSASGPQAADDIARGPGLGRYPASRDVAGRVGNQSHLPDDRTTSRLVAPRSSPRFAPATAPSRPRRSGLRRVNRLTAATRDPSRRTDLADGFGRLSTVGTVTRTRIISSTIVTAGPPRVRPGCASMPPDDPPLRPSRSTTDSTRAGPPHVVRPDNQEAPAAPQDGREACRGEQRPARTDDRASPTSHCSRPRQQPGATTAGDPR